jgi:hypothetical protein
MNLTTLGLAGSVFAAFKLARGKLAATCRAPESEARAGNRHGPIIRYKLSARLSMALKEAIFFILELQFLN